MLRKLESINSNTTMSPKRKYKNGSSWSKSITYRGVTFRSLWECYVAKLLLYSGIGFQYEPKRFYLAPGVSYLPDFYLPEMGIFIEVKGWLRQKDETRMTLFKSKVTSKFVYLGQEELSYIHGSKASDISKINYDTYVPTREEVRRFQEVLRRVR